MDVKWVLCPQVVFLDISMPEISGLYLAEQIMRACPQTGIVFVTSHDDYAIKPLSWTRSIIF